jgi:hypothetical protein
MARDSHGLSGGGNMEERKGLHTSHGKQQPEGPLTESH